MRELKNIIQLCIYRVAQNKIPHRVRIKQLQEFLKSDHWLQIPVYCILSGGYFILSHPVWCCYGPEDKKIFTFYHKILAYVVDGRLIKAANCHAL